MKNRASEVCTEYNKELAELKKSQNFDDSDIDSESDSDECDC